jgi:hypothetical protein
MDKPPCYIDEEDLNRFDEFITKSGLRGDSLHRQLASDRPRWQKALFFDLKGVIFSQIAPGGQRA